MKVIKNYYFSDQIKHPKWLLRRFKRHKMIHGVYVLREAHGTDQVEIIQSEYFLQKYLREEELAIIGFASSKDDAIELTRQLLEEAIKQTGYPDIKDYLGI